jgi:acetyl-CoA carboxylase biotin carboxyl carrier protein
MSEFNLAEGKLSGDGWKVAFKKRRTPVAAPAPSEDSLEAFEEMSLPTPAPQPVSTGTPVTSPMTGIYYTSPSPSSPPFVKTGETVSAGQVVGLIEAMKVFNEILAPVSGTVQDMPVGNGQLVQPGEPLLYIS